MGDPKKLKKKYSTPNHPWNKTAIDEGRVLTKEYGLKSKKEILVASSFLKKYKDIAKKLVANTTDQGTKEKQQVLEKLQQLGLLSVTAELDQVLGLEVKDVLERRVQSIVFRKGLARTMNQARQFIVHRHVKIGGKEVTSPSVLLTLKEEAGLDFKDKSSLADEKHPERVQEEVSKEEITVKESTPKVKSETEVEEINPAEVKEVVAEAPEEKNNETEATA